MYAGKMIQQIMRKYTKGYEYTKEEVLQGEETEVNAIQSTLSFTSSITEKEFCGMVEMAKEHIRAGDIFQVVLSQRLQSECIGDPFALYRKLRITNPSPYMFYIDFQDYVVLGSSPESLLSVREDKVMTNQLLVQDREENEEGR